MSDIALLALWLVPVLVLVASGVVLLLNRRFEQRTLHVLRALRAALRRLQSERKDLDLSAQNYKISDPEPYRAVAAALRERLASIRTGMDDLERRHVVLNERAASLKHGRLKAFFSLPNPWLKLGREAASLEREARSLSPAIELARALALELGALPWQIAQQARLLFARQLEASRRLMALQGGGLYGDTFDGAARLEAELKSSLGEIPVLFLEGNEIELIQSDPRQETALVNELLQVNKPRLSELNKKVAEWESEFNRTQEKVAAMRLSLKELDQLTRSLPSGLDVSAEKIVLRQMETIGTTLGETASRLEVESMALVAKEADRLRQACQEQLQSLDRVRRELASLEMLLRELGDGFRDLSLQLAGLSARSLYPLQWEVNLSALADLNRQANALEEVSSPRTPAQVGEDFKAAAAILASQKEVEHAIQVVALAHGELTALLQSPEVSGLPGWIQSSRELISQAGKYGHENWGRLDDFAGLSPEIDLLAAEVERLVTRKPSEPISELQVVDRLAETRRMDTNSQRLKVKLEKISTRLTSLQRSEQEAEEQVEDLQKSLSQIRLIVQSNPFLAGTAVQEIDRLMRSAQDLQDELAQTGRGSVEKKARQVSTLHGRGVDAANRWLGLLDNEVQKLRKELSGKLAELDQIARLEDPSVAEARRLLSSQTAANDETLRDGLIDRPQVRARLADLILEFKRRSSSWQECTAAQKALQEVFPLLETFHEASLQRDQALRRIKETAGWGEQRRTWPPTAVRLEAQRSELERLETEWKALKDRSTRAIALVGQFTSLASRYQSLVEKVSQSADQRKKQQSQVEELDSLIAEQAGQWENLRNEHSDNLSASREIGRFLEELDESLQAIESGYLNSELEYEDVVHQMNAVQRRARYFQVALDEDHALDVNGRILRKR